MEVKEIVHANGQTVFAWRTAGRAAVVTAVAAIIFLAVWSPTSAEVTQDARTVPGMSLAAGGERDGRAIEADRLAGDYGQWLRAAHGRAGANAQEQPLPSQF